MERVSAIRDSRVPLPPSRSGELKPAVTQAIVAVARPLGIAVHDHIIVGKDGHASLKGLRLI